MLIIVDLAMRNNYFATYFGTVLGGGHTHNIGKRRVMVDTNLTEIWGQLEHFSPISARIFSVQNISLR